MKNVAEGASVLLRGENKEIKRDEIVRTLNTNAGTYRH